MAPLRSAFLAFILHATPSLGLNVLKSGKKNVHCKRSLPFDCYIGKGVDYVGLKTTSASGRKCKNWLDEGTISSTVKGIGSHNYCRNPSGKKDQPWCFTVDPAMESEVCEVPKCPNAGKAVEAWVAPEGAKSEGEEPCEYEAPKKAGYKEYKAGRACKDNEGAKWWLITNKRNNAADKDACKSACVELAGAEYFTFWGAADEDGNNCGCYRECIPVPEDLTVNSPNVYRLD